jgi:hypothetical protein
MTTTSDEPITTPYQDRPASEGKHGDEADEPNAGPIANPVRPEAPEK